MVPSDIPSDSPSKVPSDEPSMLPSLTPSDSPPLLARSHNDGFVKEEDEPDQIISLQIGDVKMTDFLHSFSHWVLYSTSGGMLVCDLQGILDMEGKFPKFRLTDPAINTGKGQKRIGRTDLRMKGIRSFCRKHQCNKVCEGLGLPPLRRRSSRHKEIPRN